VSAPRCGTLGTRVPLIGLIGPIGCGKSTVAGWLAARGAAVIDADALTREIMAPGTPVADAIVARFGGEFRRPDGSLDRAALGRLVFADPVRLAELESIVHPAVAGLLEASIRAADSRGPAAIVLEAIKLVEAGHAPWCDEVWLVICDPETQLVRLTGRGMDEPDARQRIAAQAASLALWRAAATRTIRTEGPRDAVERAVEAALQEALARHR
jgi:dephospho-CoA kinase